jgi:hypothetical protein
MKRPKSQTKLYYGTEPSGRDHVATEIKNIVADGRRSEYPFLSSPGKSTALQNKITKLRKQEGVVTENEQEIGRMVTEFYKELY